MDVRKLFEAKFPVPNFLSFSPAYNAYHLNQEPELDKPFGMGGIEHMANVQSSYNAKFAGFRAAHELLAKDAATTEMFRTLWQRGLMLQWMHHAAKRSAGDNFDQLVDAMREILNFQRPERTLICK